MSVQANTQPDSAAGVTPSAPWRIRAFTVLPQHRLALTFNDGLQGIADMSSVRTSSNCGVYEPLKDADFFAKARLELGVVTWPNGADLDPLWLHEELSRSETWSVPI
jgi:hypothetical protein